MIMRRKTIKITKSKNKITILIRHAKHVEGKYLFPLWPLRELQTPASYLLVYINKLSKDKIFNLFLYINIHTVQT